ncbi:30S ribosomal protein S19 [Candidatus Pacearchaeota archaeon]|nr:30S ribosomal protein S19 [Candidatus Pacearchaeota archaeon]
MAAREFKYRGKNISELKALDTREFARLVGADSRRFVLRHFDVIEKFVEKCRKNSGKSKPIKTHLRNLVIVPGMINYTIGIHNGKEFVSIKIIPEMLGHRLGEFSVTRKKVEHGAPGIGATKSSAALSVK